MRKQRCTGVKTLAHDHTAGKSGIWSHALNFCVPLLWAKDTFEMSSRPFSPSLRITPIFPMFLQPHLCNVICSLTMDWTKVDIRPSRVFRFPRIRSRDSERCVGLHCLLQHVQPGGGCPCLPRRCPKQRKERVGIFFFREKGLWCEDHIKQCLWKMFCILWSCDKISFIMLYKWIGIKPWHPL